MTTTKPPVQYFQTLAQIGGVLVASSFILLTNFTNGVSDAFTVLGINEFASAKVTGALIFSVLFVGLALMIFGLVKLKSHDRA